MTGWQRIETAPRDGSEFQAWVASADHGGWEPRCRINPETEGFEIWGRVDYDEDGWDTYLHLTPTHWLPQPASPPQIEVELELMRAKHLAVGVPADEIPF